MAKVELYPHQIRAVQELDNGKILVGDVGSGKSIAAAAYYVSHEVPRDIYVITTAKKRDSLDWETEFAHFNIGKYQDATVAGVLTVDSWNNIGKYTDIHGAFFIFDEQRVVGSGQWVKAFLHIAKSNRWIMLSATPGDNWLDYIPAFIANGFFKNRTQFKREHVVYNTFSKFPKVDHYVGVGKLTRLRNSILVEMPYGRHTERITEKIRVEHDAEMFEKVVKKRWHVFEDRPIRDVAELFGVMRKVVNSDASRLEAVKALMEKHPRLIVFYNFNYELEMLRTLAHQPPYELPRSSEQTYETPSRKKTPEPSDDRSLEMSSRSSSDSSSWTGSGSSSCTCFPEAETSARNAALFDPQPIVHGCAMHGSTRTSETTSPSFAVAEWNGHKHEPVPTTDRWVYLVQYVAGAEGWNCVDTNAMCFYSLTYSYKNFHQAHGRIDRLNTPFTKLYYYVLMSSSVIDKSVWKSLSGKRSFNESAFKKQFADISGTGVNRQKP